MPRSLVVFLVFLRLAIGWHFLVEGWQKVQSPRPFSSAGYFGEAPGPLGKAVRWWNGNPDQEALALLTPKPAEDATTKEPQSRCPDLLKQRWQAWLDAYMAHYDFDSEQKQLARAKLEQAEADVVVWLTYRVPATEADRAQDKLYDTNTKLVTRSLERSDDAKLRMTVEDRLAEYRDKLRALADANDRLWKFGRDVEGPKLRQAKGDVVKIRTDLLAELDTRTKAFQKSIEDLRTSEQKAMGRLPENKPSGPIVWIDAITPWMLVAIGCCMLVGLFSRTSALLAAGFLFMTYLAVPALPWYPTPPASEGNYLVVNKNLVEMLALCVLVTVPTGRWFGLDALLHQTRKAIFGEKPTKV